MFFLLGVRGMGEKKCRKSHGDPLSRLFYKNCDPGLDPVSLESAETVFALAAAIGISNTKDQAADARA
jgi:hypothetical protein